MTADQQSSLRAMLRRLGAEDLAMEVAAVEDVRDLDAATRGAIIDVLGHEAAERGLNRDGSVNDYWLQLDELADALVGD